ncbi:MAG TPA: methylated-DNA--[protein]-cysteine S-methyltransferase [Ktedonobacterales bacterium]|nr:methylated-DNA--[protein]-cysteine S-methyltransferase [Ktedonobacterales bacterium]
MSQGTRSSHEGSLREARQLAADLRALGVVAAPIHIAEGALARAGLADQYTTIETPLGTVYIAWSQEGLSLALRAMDEEEFRMEARALLGRAVTPGQPPERLARGARAWLAGDGRVSLSFDLARLTPFERAVLMKAREIPRGEVRPYGWIAREIGRPGATRAVGTALARNPVPLFIPCHRVVRTDGHIGNYSMGGPEAKRTILTFEGVDVDELERLAASGARYIGNDESRYYCYPTCHGARNTSPAHRVGFSNETQAYAAGYRPCGSCRPPEAQLAG